MVKNYIVLFVLGMLWASCSNQGPKMADNQNNTPDCIEISANSNYLLFENDSALPDSLSRSKWKKRELNWCVFPPYGVIDWEAAGILNGDTIVRIIACNNGKDYIELNKIIANVQNLLKTAPFKRFEAIQINFAPPPDLYEYGNLYILECTLPNGWGMDERYFYVIVPKK
jgi:hypothetical protein